jgi:GT2 family glycosyltransferase
MLRADGQKNVHSPEIAPSKSDPLVYIVLLSWNNWRDTLMCLRSLESMNYRSWNVVIVDNGSEDESVERLREAHPDTTLIENGKNLGFAAGSNVGIRYAIEHSAEFVWLLNADTTVEKDTLGAMVKRAVQDPTVGAIGSVIHYMDKPTEIQAWGGGHVNFWIGRSRHIRRPDNDSALDFITGASMLIPRQALACVGPFDEGFFMYWEDADYCYRLRAAGWRIATASDSVIYHKGSATFAGRGLLSDAYFTDSASRFFRKHGKYPALSLWAGVGLSILKRIILGRWETIRAVWPGRFASIRGRNSRGI